MDYDAAEEAREKAYRRYKAAVCRLTKYERRRWTKRIPEAQEEVKRRRQELYEHIDNANVAQLVEH